MRVELDVNGSAGWLESEELDVLLLPLLAAAQRKLPTEVLCSDETACAQRCAKAFLAVKVHPCVSLTVSFISHQSLAKYFLLGKGGLCFICQHL